MCHPDKNGHASSPRESVSILDFLKGHPELKALQFEMSELQNDRISGCDDDFEDNGQPSLNAGHLRASAKEVTVGWASEAPEKGQASLKAGHFSFSCAMASRDRTEGCASLSWNGHPASKAGHFLVEGSSKTTGWAGFSAIFAFLKGNPDCMALQSEGAELHNLLTSGCDLPADFGSKGHPLLKAGHLVASDNFDTVGCASDAALKGHAPLKAGHFSFNSFMASSLRIEGCLALSSLWLKGHPDWKASQFSVESSDVTSGCVGFDSDMANALRIRKAATG